MGYQEVLDKIKSVENYMNEHKLYINKDKIGAYTNKLNELKIKSYIVGVNEKLDEIDSLINMEKYDKAKELLNSARNLLDTAKRMDEEFEVPRFSNELAILTYELSLRDVQITMRGKIVEGFPSELYKKYNPLEKLGTTNLSKVFKVKRKSDGKIIALKVPKEDCEEYIKIEYEILKKLNHPYIVKTYGYYETPIPHMELEYVEGYNLNGKIIERLKDYPKPMDEDKLIELIKKIAKGLAHAHHNKDKIIHKDINPSNILLTPEFNPKIIDFNIAKEGDGYSIVKGYTENYAAPEQIDPNGKTDERTDIYILGIVFYEYLVGEHPGNLFNTSKFKEILEKIPYKYRPMFGNLLAYDKEKRFQSIDEFIAELNELNKSEPKTYVPKKNSSSEFNTSVKKRW